jgi:branched-chain amino acid transport system substrate-binding protein
VTETAILIGGTAPLTGDASYARGAAAYLAHVNGRGGVRGRTVSYRLLDDGGDPARALAATQELVERDGVFAVFGTVGTPASAAVRAYLSGAKVPQLFVASGAAALAGFRPSYRAEGWIYGSFLVRTRPGAKVGVLHSADADGRELLAGLRQAVARTRISVVAAPTVADLQASGADVLALFVPAQDAVAAAGEAAALGWAPLLAVAAEATGARRWPAGAISIGWAKDPAEPRWRGDEALAPYRSLLRGRGVSHVQGMAAAFELVRLLRAAGEEPTRADVVARSTRLASGANPFLLPGIVVRTGLADRFPIEQAALRRSTGRGWRSVGGLWRHIAR